MGSLYPDIREIYPNTHTSTLTPTPSPSYVSLFEDILSLSHFHAHDVSNDPKQSASAARQLVISIFLAFLRRRYLNLLGLQSRFSFSQAINRCDYLRSFMDGSLSTWQHELFGFIVNAKFRLNVLLKEIEDNMAALGLSPNVANGTAAIPSWERDGWTAVHESCTTVLNMTNMLLDSYLQFVSVEEAQSSNRVAKSLARITVVTTLFIPLSTVAAILSMNETFLPGSQYDWVFWAVSLPILLVIGVVYGKKSFPSLSWGSGGKKRYILPVFRDKSRGV
ncbi:hypothetical protein HFD88_008302 [Aspergillus terreus]|nr:hypothetical protein HFD88_008302 [Aspergillus terreus]